ncbi:UNVERIFIED_CONTAM: hypothetical protein PYX00_001036 [Menopon gallinae]|uniref:Uncharacterized protein n=1 Tax=Menopon gallinae TaxID=328185 RepID=A0AAW2ICI0_9NEOP
MKEIDKFLEAIETTPIPEGRDTFMMIWKKEKPEKISTIVLVASLFFVYAWVVRGVYIAAVSEKVPPPPYWSPFFERSIYIQWIYVLQDLVMAFPMIYVSWYTDMTFTSLITFHHAQLLYVRRLAHLIPENGYPRENRENLIWWIKVHQQILRSVYKVNDLLGLHAFCSYCTQTCFAVLSIVVLLFQGLNLTSSQRIFCLSLSVCQLLWFGYTCRIVDKWEEEQNDIQQSLFSEKLMGSDKWLLSAYKIIMVRLNRPLKFTGLQFVTINSVTFRVMVFNIYSLYTSLMSILNAKTAVQPEE